MNPILRFRRWCRIGALRKARQSLDRERYWLQEMAWTAPESHGRAKAEFFAAFARFQAELWIATAGYRVPRRSIPEKSND